MKINNTFMLLLAVGLVLQLFTVTIEDFTYSLILSMFNILCVFWGLIYENKENKQ